MRPWSALTLAWLGPWGCRVMEREQLGGTMESCNSVKHLVVYVQVGKNRSPAVSNGPQAQGSVDRRTGQLGVSLEHPSPTASSHGQLPGRWRAHWGLLGAATPYQHFPDPPICPPHQMYHPGANLAINHYFSFSLKKKKSVQGVTPCSEQPSQL